VAVRIHASEKPSGSKVASGSWGSRGEVTGVPSGSSSGGRSGALAYMFSPPFTE
jgi:hypothetical protein